MLRRLCGGSLGRFSDHPRLFHDGRHTSNGEIPRHERNSNTNRLLNCKDSTIRCSWCLHRSLNTLRLASKPPGEAQSIVNLALRFKERLSGFVSDNVGQIVAVIANQLVPFQQTLGTSPGVDFAEGLESLVCCFNSCIGVFCNVVWCGCPYFAVTWVCILILLAACN